MEVCLDPSSKGDPKAVDCPANRTAAVGPQPGVVDCAAINGSAWLRLGIEVPYSACASRAAPCAAVPALPSACKVVTVLQQNMPVSDFEASWGGSCGTAAGRVRRKKPGSSAFLRGGLRGGHTGAPALLPTTCARVAASPTVGLCTGPASHPHPLPFWHPQAQYRTDWDSVSWLNK